MTTPPLDGRDAAVTEWKPPDPQGPGWVPFGDLDGIEAPAVAAHFTSDGPDGRLRVDAVRVASPTLDSGMLRAISIPAFEAWANSPTGREAMGRVFSRTAAERAADLRPGSVGRKRARLKIPPGAKPDSFYKRVAEVYRELAAWSNRPAVELAEVNSVPVTTAHRWVKEARRRGFLPPGRKGRRG
jgi:hypothetical protein